jgi:hypothetical protein
VQQKAKKRKLQERDVQEEEEEEKKQKLLEEKAQAEEMNRNLHENNVQEEENNAGSILFTNMKQHKVIEKQSPPCFYKVYIISVDGWLECCKKQFLRLRKLLPRIP